jgi:sulfatase modifying factor 1
MKSVLIATLLLSMAAAGQIPPAQPAGKQNSGRRMALVIGNQNYAKLSPLPAVPREVELIRKALSDAGFKVMDAKNGTLDELEKVLKDFTDQLQPGDICVFYYSGYATRNENYDFLIPVDFDPSAKGNLSNLAYPVKLLAQNLGEKEVGLKMFFLEGARKFDANIPEIHPGLMVPDTGELTDILFGIPAASNQYVDTPPDQVGLFTAALADTINRQGVRITELMTEILNQVLDKSNKQQQPVKGDRLTTADFYFHEPPPPPPPSSQQNHRDREFYVWIPPGTFLMGCVPTDTKCDNNEKPQHQVTLTKGFWMGQNEVQVVSYRRFMAADKKTHRKMPPAYDVNKKWKVDDYPISGMKWEDAADYCSWSGGRLPTEAEWERAARGTKDNSIYPFDPTDPVKSREKANFDGIAGNDRFPDIAPVRQFDANEYGLYDMAGNVWEFVSDFFGRYPETPVVDPQGPETGKIHVRRGGSFNSDPKKHLRISVRVPSGAEVNVGFRCVMDDTPATKQLFTNQ